MSLSAQLQSFVDGPAELAAARALAYDRGAGLALVAALTDKKLRSHLEALGEVASDKEVKKAARAAAYKLKSAGVSGGVQREAGIDLSVKIETEGVAAATAPGFDGRLWLVLSSLPGAGGGELDLRDGSGKQRIDPIQELSLGRVRRFHGEVSAQLTLQPPVLADLDLAARLVGIAAEALALSGRPVPPAMEHFKAWGLRAVALGADPNRASARATLGPAGRPLPVGAIDVLAEHPRLGFLAAPPEAFEPIDKEFRALLHGQEAIEKDAFLAQGKALVEQAARLWWSSATGRKLAALWLDATADVLMVAADHDAARIALAASDELLAWDGDPLAHPLVERAFKGAVDLEAAWMHREAHMRGEAHHGHE